VNDGLFLVARIAAHSLGETLEWLGSDDRHYTREIANVGAKTKLLVGKPEME